MKIFIVPGYGIPKDIFKDVYYGLYLKRVTLTIKKFLSDHPRTRVSVIFSGGNTDVIPPFNRTEASEMLNLFKSLFPDYQKIDTMLEEDSLSSLENQINSKRIIDKLGKKIEDITLFCERSKIHRIKTTARMIFSKISVVGIKLPQSRQAPDTKLFRDKEELILRYSLRALKDKKSLDKFRNIFIEKFKYLRKYPPEEQNAALSLWWKRLLSETKNEYKAKSER